MRHLLWVFLSGVFCLLVCALPSPSGNQAPTDTKPNKNLSDFGPTGTPAEAQATYEKALKELKQQGGILVVPGATWKLLKDVPLQGLIRIPTPPAETKQWKTDKAVTVVVVNEQH